MEPALKAMLGDRIAITPVGQATTGGYGAGALGSAVSGIPARVKVGRRKVQNAVGEEVVALHEILIDADVLVGNPPRPPAEKDIVTLADTTHEEIARVKAVQNETGAFDHRRLFTAR